MTPNDAAPRERVEGRAWAVRHLSAALATEDVDEKDYHVSLARQLLRDADPDTAGQNRRQKTPAEADERS